MPSNAKSAITVIGLNLVAALFIGMISLWPVAAESNSGNEVLAAGARPGIEASLGTTVQGGHTGAWYNRAQDGHGLFVEVLSDSSTPTGVRVLLAWYVYLDGQQIWILAEGPVIQEGNRQRVFLDAWIFSGGDFPPFFDPSMVEQDVWGTMTLQFNGCNAAEFTWDTSFPGFTSGQLDLERLSNILNSDCDPDLGGDSGGGISDDHGDTWQTATFLRVDVGIDGAIDPQADIDVFELDFTSITDLARIQVFTTSGSLDTTGELFRLVDGVEHSLAFDDDSGVNKNFLLDVNLLQPGRYMVHVKTFTGTGDYTIWYQLSQTQKQENIRVDFENRLLKDIRILKNGNALGIVPATETMGSTYSVKVGDRFSFEVVQEFGDIMTETYPAISNLGVSQINYVADNIIGSDRFFIPYITNNTSVAKLLGVNVGLVSQNLCNCTIAANTANVGVGYFRLFSSGNLRLYEDGSGYTGPFSEWTNFSGSAQTDTGRIDFTENP